MLCIHHLILSSQLYEAGENRDAAVINKEMELSDLICRLLERNDTGISPWARIPETNTTLKHAILQLKFFNN